MSHTPGPWYWVKYPKTKTIRLMGAKQLIVMDFARWGMQSAQPRFIQIAPSGMELMIDAKDIDIEADPNACLIAAAPDLLEALKNLVEACWRADVDGDLSGYVDGTLLNAADEAIAKAGGKQ